MTDAFQIAPRRWYVKDPPERNPAYRRFIRKLPCCVCCKTRGIEAAHFGPHGTSQKSSDKYTLPLCHACHRTGNQSYHKLGPRQFAEVHELDVWALIAKLNAFWDEKIGGKAA
jgi:hypothetical protein